MSFTEQDFENAIIELMRDELSYGYIYGPNVVRDYRSPLHEEMLTIVDGINFIIGDEHKKELFVKEALYLKQAASLCRSLLNKTQRFEAAFFEAVRTALTRIVTGKKLSLKEINDRINELLKQSIKSEGVINLFSDVKTEFSLFDPAFMEEIAKMQQKNLAAELLKKLIQEQITVYKRTNMVKSELF